MDNDKIISAKQIILTLEILAEHKSSGFDITRMIKRSIASGYSGIITPTKDYLTSSKKSLVTTERPSFYAPNVLPNQGCTDGFTSYLTLVELLWLIHSD